MVDCSAWSCSGRGTPWRFTNATDSVAQWTSRELAQAARGQLCICRCDDGWRNSGDLYGAHCRIHSVTVYVLWAITAVICGLLVIVCLRFLYAYWRHNRSLRPSRTTPLAASFLQNPPPLPPPVAAAVATVPAAWAPAAVANGESPHLFLSPAPVPTIPTVPTSDANGGEASLLSAPFHSRGGIYVPRYATPAHGTTQAPEVPPAADHAIMHVPGSAVSTMSNHGDTPAHIGVITAPVRLPSPPPQSPHHHGIPPPTNNNARVHAFTVRPSVTGTDVTIPPLLPTSPGGVTAGRRATVIPVAATAAPTPMVSSAPRLLSLPQVQYVLLVLSTAIFYFATAVVKLQSVKEPLEIAYDLFPTLLYGIGASLISWCIFLHAWRIIIVAESISSDHSLTAHLHNMKRGLHMALLINCLSYAILLVPIYYHGGYNNDVNAYWTDNVQEKCVVAHLMVKTFSLGISGPLIHAHYAKKLLKLLHATSNIVGRTGASSSSGQQQQHGGGHAAGAVGSAPESAPSTPIQTVIKSPGVTTGSGGLTSPIGSSQQQHATFSGNRSPVMDMKVSTTVKPTPAQSARRALADSINRLTRQATRLALAQMTIMIVIAYWPYARAFGAYLMPLIMGNGGWVILLSVLVLPKPTIAAPRIITEVEQHQHMEASARIVRHHTLNDTADAIPAVHLPGMADSVGPTTAIVGWAPSILDQHNKQHGSLVAAGSSVRVRITPPQLHHHSRSDMVEESVAVNHDQARGGGTRSPRSHYHDYEPSSVHPPPGVTRGPSIMLSSNSNVHAATAGAAVDGTSEPVVDRIATSSDHDSSNHSVRSSPPSINSGARASPSSRAPSHVATAAAVHHSETADDAPIAVMDAPPVIAASSSLPFTVAMTSVPLDAATSVMAASSSSLSDASSSSLSLVPLPLVGSTAIRSRLAVGRVPMP